MEYGPYAYFEGRIVPTEEAKVSIITHSFNYGTAIFEGIRGYWNAEHEQLYIFKLREHYERMFRNFRILKIEPPLSIDEACAATMEVALKNNFREDMYIRPIGYKSTLAISPRVHGLDNEFCIYNIPLGDYVDVSVGLNLMVSSWRRLEDNAIPGRGKIVGSYVNSSLAATEAKESGFDEAILLCHDGHVSEASAMNLMLVQDGRLVSAPRSANILEGITLFTLAQAAKEQMKLETEFRDVDRTELYTADEVFVCGTGAQVAPVTSIDRRPIGDGKPGPVTERLQKLYFDIVRGDHECYPAWRTPVYG